MSTKERALKISEAIQHVQREINLIEQTLYYTDAGRDRLRVLKRARRALSHDLDQLVVTLPSPLQLPLFDMLVSDSNPLPAEKINDPLNERVEAAGDPLIVDGDDILLRRYLLP